MRFSIYIYIYIFVLVMSHAQDIEIKTTKIEHNKKTLNYLCFY